MDRDKLRRVICNVWLVAAVALLAAGPALAQPALAQETADDGPAPTAPPDAPQLTLDLASPRATLLTTYFPAINRITRGEGDLDRAWEHVLATMQWEDVASEAEAREAALQLLDVFDKLGTVTDEHLPSQDELQQADISRFVFFPQPTEHGWVWDELRAFNRWPEGRIVLVRTDAGWQFSAETVAGASRLAESFSPLQPRHLAPQVESPVADAFLSVLGPTFEQTRWWGWLALLAMIFVGLAAGKLASAILRRTGDRLEARQWHARSAVFHDAASPVSLAIFSLGLAIGLESIALTEELSTLRWQIIQFLYLFALGWFLYNLVNLVDVGLHRYIEAHNRKLDEVVITLIRRTLRIFLVIMFALVVAENVFGLNVTAWIAGFGIAGLAISLAAQDSVRNLFGSLTVFFDKPFAVGDMITFGGTTGTVEAIGFRSTKQRLFSGAVVSIPNAKFIDGSVENITRRKTIRA